jgi:hypothetical protein
MSRMEKLFIKQTQTSPEIHFSVDDNFYRISGTSSPEDARALYYPIIDWIKKLTDNILNGTINRYSTENPFRLQVDLLYFNSSSAKFLYDIISELKRLIPSGIPLIIEWHYEKDDPDHKEAGEDISLLADMDFTYVIKEAE